MRACFLARVTKRLIIEDGMNYRAWTRKKKKKEKRAYRESLSFSPQNKWILLFRVIGAYQTGWTRISRLFSRTESTYRDREPNEEENRTPCAFRFASIRCKSKGDIRVDERTGSQRVLETRWFFLQIIPLENNRINVRPSLFSRMHHHKSKLLIFETWHRCHYF